MAEAPNSIPSAKPDGFLIGAAIGSGATALAAERGGADLLLAINAGRLRSMGAPSIACMLPVFDAGALTERFAREELLALCRKPVLLGLNVWEESCEPAEIAERVRAAGFAGAVNFPSCMHYSHAMQQILSRAARGIEKEVAVLKAVKEAGLISMFYCATRTQARLAADAGLDFVCLNLGWNVGGAMGHRTRQSLEEVATAAREIGRHIKRINPEVRFLLEGGPIATAEDLAQIAAHAPVDGYVGGSTFERMPLEVSVAEQIDAFRRAGGRRAPLDPESSRLVAWGRRQGFVGRSKALLAFLGRLNALAKAEAPLLLLSEPGLDPWPALDALRAAGGRNRKGAVATLDIAGEDFPARARRLLFGQSGGGEAQALPLLADEKLDMIVLHAPERLPPGMQRRLARSLREGRFRAPDTRRTLEVLPRVVAVTEAPGSQDLAALGYDPELLGLFDGWTLRLPPLRDRIEDLPALLDAISARDLGGGLGRKDFTAAALRRLQAHRWPGNEAELRGLLGALAGHGGTAVQPKEVAPLLEAGQAEEPELPTEKDRIVDALWRHGFNRTRTAEALGISRKTLFNKIKKFGLAG